ncbi:hypothetical protein N9R79_12080, partial [Vibrio sp.]|nr:hypothetical protein [Vibrio sp.]
MTEDELGVVSRKFDYLSRSPNGRYIGFTDEDYHFNLFDLKTRQMVVSIEDESSCTSSVWNVDSSLVAVNCRTSTYSINTQDYSMVRGEDVTTDSYREVVLTQGRLAYNQKNNTLYTAPRNGHFHYFECEEHEYEIEPPYTSCANGMSFDFATLEYQDKDYYYRESISPLEPDEGSCNLRGDLTGNYFTCQTVAKEGEGFGIYSFDDYKVPVAFAPTISNRFYLHNDRGYWYHFTNSFKHVRYEKSDNSPVIDTQYFYRVKDFWGESTLIKKSQMVVSQYYMTHFEDIDLREHLPPLPTYDDFRHALETRNEQ